jgi:hypothetical protein
MVVVVSTTPPMSTRAITRATTLAGEVAMAAVPGAAA